jgi:hypothetical protein
MHTGLADMDALLAFLALGMACRCVHIHQVTTKLAEAGFSRICAHPQKGFGWLTKSTEASLLSNA